MANQSHAPCVGLHAGCGMAGLIWVGWAQSRGWLELGGLGWLEWLGCRLGPSGWAGWLEPAGWGWGWAGSSLGAGLELWGLRSQRAAVAGQLAQVGIRA